MSPTDLQLIRLCCRTILRCSQHAELGEYMLRLTLSMNLSYRNSLDALDDSQFLYIADRVVAATKANTTVAVSSQCLIHIGQMATRYCVEQNLKGVRR